MTEKWPRDADSTRQPHIGAVEGRHQWNVREPADPGPNDAIGEPPMSVNYLRLEGAFCSHRVNEVRAEKADERQLRCPR